MLDFFNVTTWGSAVQQGHDIDVTQLLVEAARCE